MADSSYQLILLDVDGTLMDFEAAETHALKLCWQHFFQEVTELEPFMAFFRKLNLQIWKEVENGMLKPFQVNLVRAQRAFREFGMRTHRAPELGQLFVNGLSQIARWLPGAEEGFNALAKRYQVGLVTNGLSAVQNPRIEALGIRSMLSTVQISEEAGATKPRREIFEKALEETGCASETTLMVGDSVSSDFQGACNAGLDFCWVVPKGVNLPLGFPNPKYRARNLPELVRFLQ